MTTQNRKRVVLVGPAYPFRGGIAHFTDAMAGGLSERGHDVSIVTFSRQYPAFLFPGKTQYEHDEARRGNAMALVDSVNPITWLSAGTRIARMHPDAVIFQYWLPFFAPAYGVMGGRIRRRSADTRLLSVAHNIFPHEKRPGDAALGRYFLGKCDGIVALSASVADDGHSLGTDAEIRTLVHPAYEHFGPPLARDAARLDLRIPADAEVVLFFGFIREYKGLQVLLRALPAIIRERPAAHLVIAGEFYENESGYRAQIRASGVEERVHLFADYVPESKVPTFFSAADVIVQPYLTATQSGVVQTAYHFERPVVVTDVGGLAEVVPHEKAGLVVPPNDAEALAAAVVRFFAEGMEEALVEGVRREKEIHGWDSFCAAVEEMFE